LGWRAGIQRHREFAGKTIIAKDNAAILDHSTHVAGTMIAKGVYAPVKGMAYGTTSLSAWDFDNDVSEMSAAASGLLLSNHSYGEVGGWDYNSSESRWEWYGLPGDTRITLLAFTIRACNHGIKLPITRHITSLWSRRVTAGQANGPAVGATYYGFTSRTNSTFINKGARPANISSNNGYDIITTRVTPKIY
jgi:hypothetical protein